MPTTLIDRTRLLDPILVHTAYQSSRARAAGQRVAGVVAFEVAAVTAAGYLLPRWKPTRKVGWLQQTLHIARDVEAGAYTAALPSPCYDATVFNLGRPKTAGGWIVHIAGAIVAIFLVWWMLRLYVL